MLGYDPDNDPHRFNPEVHYRLYLGRDDKPTVICVQDFDYHHYDPDRFIGNAAFGDEKDAETGLRQVLIEAATLLGVLPDYLRIDR